MRRRIVERIALPLLVTALVASPCLAGKEGTATPGGAAADALERLKQLTGTWRGTNSAGSPVEVRYELVGDETAVMEHLDVRGEQAHHNMVTLYHLDGDTLMLTHYCAAGNQPRMRATSISRERLRFDFVDATNLAGPDAGHMHGLTFELGEQDRITARWTWRENGADAHTEVLKLARTASAASR